MKDIEHLIHQACRELQIIATTTEDGDKVRVSFSRKDGTQGECVFAYGDGYRVVHDTIKAESKSEVSATKNKDAEIAALEARLKELKSE